MGLRVGVYCNNVTILLFDVFCMTSCCWWFIAGRFGLPVLVHALGFWVWFSWFRCAGFISIVFSDRDELSWVLLFWC